MIEIGMWVFIVLVMAYAGYRVGHMFVDADALAERDIALARATHWEQLSDQHEAELLELQEQYQNLYQRDQKLRDAVKKHRAAGQEANCGDVSCEKGCGYDLMLWTALDETDVSVAGLFPKLAIGGKVNGTRPTMLIMDEVKPSVWDAMRDGLPESDDDLPGMWERADFEGGLTTVRDAEGNETHE